MKTTNTAEEVGVSVGCCEGLSLGACVGFVVGDSLGERVGNGGPSAQNQESDRNFFQAGDSAQGPGNSLQERSSPRN